jgi:hypothetical protein
MYIFDGAATLAWPDPGSLTPSIPDRSIEVFQFVVLDDGMSLTRYSNAVSELRMQRSGQHFDKMEQPSCWARPR